MPTSALPFSLPALIGPVAPPPPSPDYVPPAPPREVHRLALRLPTRLNRAAGIRGGGDTITFTVTDGGASITTGTSGAILTKTASDTISFTLADASVAVEMVTVVPVTASDTITFTATDSSTGGTSGVHPHGLRADDLILQLHESAHAYPNTVLTEPSIIIPPVIKFAEPRIKGSLNTGSADDAIQSCKDLATMLKDADWTLADTIAAVGIMNIISMPVIPDFGLFFALSFFNFEARIGRLRYNVNFAFYDPNHFDPSTQGAPGQVLVLLGSTEAGSLANLIAAINGNTPFSATAITTESGYLYTLELTAKDPGPDGNTYRFDGAYYTPGCRPSHGGYVMQSKDTSIDDVAQTVLTLTIMVGDSDALCFRCDVDGNAMEATLSGNIATSDPRRSTNLNMGFTLFDVFADPYQVFISAADDSYIGGCTAMYFASPWISPYASVGECAFLRVGFSLIRNSLYNYYNASTIVDGEIYDQSSSGFDITQGWGMLMDHEAGHGVKLWTASDPRFYQDAVVMLSKGNEPIHAVGYLYNAFLTGEEPGDVALRTIRYLKISGTIYTGMVMANNASWAAGNAAHGILYLITE